MERERNAAIKWQEKTVAQNEKLNKFVRQLREDNLHLTEQLENQTK